MTPEQEIQLRKAFRDDLPFFAEHCLRIRPKAGSLTPFRFNRGQLFLHDRLQRQLRDTGRVRVIVLKGRQMGMSTYIGGRYYQRTIHRQGWRTFILTHEQPATDNLFGMVERFHEHCPPMIKPATGAANAKELSFAKLDSGYRVGTAGTKEVGRSQTIQMFHGSEVAFWPNAEDHTAGIMQAVPDEDWTEVILESTANGIGNFFHTMWQEAVTGENGYEAVFIPWFWEPTYRTKCSHDVGFSAEEQEVAEFHGLDRDQLLWRRNKIRQLAGREVQFKQEYPCTPEEAFQSTGDSLISGRSVQRALSSSTKPLGPLIVGVDPAWYGGDRTAIAWRRGRAVTKVWARSHVDLMELAGRVKQIIDNEQPARVFIDVGGVGAGVYSRLMEWGSPYTEVVRKVDFAGKALPHPRNPKNKRAEMWLRMQEWLDDEEIPANLPAVEGLAADLCSPGYKPNSYGQFVLESKEDIKKRGLRSPDLGDAIALTFAEPVAGEFLAAPYEVTDRYRRPLEADGGEVSHWAS